MVEPLIIKMDINMRESIFPIERLALIMRFLATGQTSEDLKYSSVIVPTIISQIVMENCEAIVTVLKNHIEVNKIIYT